MGIVASLMLGSETYRRHMADEIDRLIPAIWLDQVLFFYDWHHRVCGLAAWATVSPSVEEAIKADGAAWLDESEWNEGDTYWVTDLIARFGLGWDVMAALKLEMSRRTRLFKFIRRSDRRHSVRSVRC